MEPSPIILASAADRNYAQPLGVMLTSVAANLGRNSRLTACVIDLGIRADDRSMIERAVAPWRTRIEWIEGSLARYGGLPLWGRMSAATYAKLDLAELMPASAHRAIWLDCDLVVTSDITRLWEEPLEKHLLLAVPDEVVSTVSSPGGVSAFAALGLPASTPYFNAGVMVLNLSGWRREHVRERSLDYLRRNGEDVFFWDQEALNVAVAGRWRALDARWNLNASVPASHRDMTLFETTAAPWIVHFTGRLKPWEYPSSMPSLRQLYFRYLDMTPWAGWRPAPSATLAAVGWYEQSGVRLAMYPLEKFAMRLSRRLSRRTAVHTDNLDR